MKHPLFRLVGGLVLGVLMTVLFLADPRLSWMNGLSGAAGSTQALKGLMLGLIVLILLGLGLRGRQPDQKATVNHFSVEIYRQRRLRRLQGARRQHHGW